MHLNYDAEKIQWSVSNLVYCIVYNSVHVCQVVSSSQLAFTCRSLWAKDIQKL